MGLTMRRIMARTMARTMARIELTVVRSFQLRSFRPRSFRPRSFLQLLRLKAASLIVDCLPCCAVFSSTTVIFGASHSFLAFLLESSSGLP